MKFRCERDVLVEALTTAGRASTTRAALPVLSGLRLVLRENVLRVTGSDLDLTITVEVEVAGIEDGVVVLPARLAADYVRSLGAGAVEIDDSGDRVRISSGRSESFLNAIAADEYPNPPETVGESVTVESGVLAEALRQVVEAASGDETRPILTGVFMTPEQDGLRLVATDSYRLAVRDMPGQSVLREGQQVLVPSRALNEVARALEGRDSVVLVLGERDATFEVGPLHLSTRLIEGDFPNYKQLIPESQPNRLIVDRLAMAEAVRRVKLLAKEDRNVPVRLTMRAESLELRTVTQDVGEAVEELDAKYEGAELTVAFNPDYLLDGLEVTSGEEVTLETSDALRPATLRSIDAPEFLYLLMPVRVS